MRASFLVPALLSALAAAAASPLPTGGARFVLQEAEPIEVFTYKPAGYQQGPLLVVMHGVNRNAEDYRRAAMGLADRLKALVVVPCFDAARFPGERYQRGGITAHGIPRSQERWTFSVILRLVSQVRALEGQPQLPWYLIGHSAGGQFANRMAAFMPEGPRRIVAANPGSLLFPTREAPYGYGFGKLPPQLSNDEALQRYLAAPLTLYLGEEDQAQDDQLDASPQARKQGETRLERGRACFEAARALAESRHWPFRWRKVEVAGIGHSARRMFNAEEMEDALSGEKPQGGTPGAHVGR